MFYITMTVKAFNPDSPLNERRMVIRRSGEDVETVDLPWGLQPREPGARRDLVDIMADWVPDEAVRNRIFAGNAAECFGFPPP